MCGDSCRLSPTRQAARTDWIIFCHDGEAQKLVDPKMIDAQCDKLILSQPAQFECAERP